MCRGTKENKKTIKNTILKGENVNINLYVSGDQAELLTALAEHDGVTIEECANELFEDLLARIWESIKEEFMS